MTNARLSCRRDLWATACAALMLASGCHSGSDDSLVDAKGAAVSAAATDREQALARAAAARKSAQAGDYRAAVDLYTQALNELRPAPRDLDATAPDADLLYERGLAWLELGFPDTAAADFSATLRQRRDHGPAFAHRADAHLQLDDLYRAVRDATEALRLDPSCADAFRARGLAYLGRSQFERATVDLDQAIALHPALEAELKPALARAYRSWSTQLAAGGDAAEAAAKLAHAHELAPAMAEAPAALTPPAAETRTVAKPVVDDARAHFARGCELQTQKQYDEAIIAFTEAIALDRKYVDAYVRRAETLLAAGFPDSALKDARQALRYDDRSADAYRLEARAFARLGSYHRVALSATEALHVDPLDVGMYALRGRAYLKLRAWDRAIADLEEAMRRQPALTAELHPLLEDARLGAAEADALTPAEPLGAADGPRG